MNIQTQKIETVIFDLGGVLYDVDYELSRQALIKYSDNPELLTEKSKSEFINIAQSFEKGLIRPSEFRNHFRKEFSIDATDEQFDQAWNAMLISLFEDTKEILEYSKQNANIFLLSNTNEIHFNRFIKECERLLTYFNFSYFSHHINMRKPDKEIYQYVMKHNKLVPQTTLFIDDLAQNTMAAAELGINTYTCKDRSKLSDFLHSVL